MTVAIGVSGTRHLDRTHAAPDRSLQERAERVGELLDGVACTPRHPPRDMSIESDDDRPLGLRWKPKAGSTAGSIRRLMGTSSVSFTR
jgi:hypothetical protein